MRICCQQSTSTPSISLNPRMSADPWFSLDTLSLASHVHSIHLSMETIPGTECKLSRFSCIKMLHISDWCGSQHALPTVWSPLNRMVEHLELVQSEGTPHEILTLVSSFTSLELFCIACSHQQSKCEVQSTYTVDPATISIRFRTLRHPPADGIGFALPYSGNGISVWLCESG